LVETGVQIDMSEEKTKYCPYCGVQIDYKYTTCPSCGKPQPKIEGLTPIHAVQRKNPVLAAALSLLITGAGQIYLGRVSRGILFLGTVLLIGYLLQDILTFDELMIVGIVFSIISAWDAYNIAKKINE
jgi:TM2 domain-containing membrane protein YozV